MTKRKEKEALGIVSFEEVQDIPVSWLWEPYIQRGKITILRGDPGAGKTYFACGIMAALSQDAQPEDMPGIMWYPRGRCVYIGGEDDPETMRARLRNAGAVDFSGLFTVSGADLLLTDAGRLKSIIAATAADLLIFDPIQAFLGRGVDMNRANEIRPVLEIVQGIAQETGCAVLMIEHKNKNQKAAALYRGIGSMDITAAARSVLMVEEDPGGQGRRYTVQVKSNARKGPDILWSIEEDGRFIWRGSSDKWADVVEDRKRLEVTPAARYAGAILKRHPGGWSGTLAELTGEIDGEPAGRSILNKLGKELNAPETQRQLLELLRVNVTITNRGNRKHYHFSRAGSSMVQVADPLKECPEEIAPAFSEYMEHRGKIGKPIDPGTVPKILRRLETIAGGDTAKQAAILEQSIVNGWAGIFPLKEEPAGDLSAIYAAQFPDDVV